MLPGIVLIILGGAATFGCVEFFKTPEGKSRMGVMIPGLVVGPLCILVGGGLVVMSIMNHGSGTSLNRNLISTPTPSPSSTPLGTDIMAGDTRLSYDVRLVQEKYGIILVGDDLAAQFPLEEDGVGFVSFIVVDTGIGVVNGKADGVLLNRGEKQFDLIIKDKTGLAVEYEKGQLLNQ